MQPIFPEYIRFLNDNGVETPWFRERTFWMDNNVVKAFRKSDGRLLYPDGSEQMTFDTYIADPVTPHIVTCFGNATQDIVS